MQIAKAPDQLQVPRGKGSKTPDDFNGDGRRDLVLNGLAKAESHAHNAGVGIVHGSERGLSSGARQLVSPKKQGAAAEGRLPAVFDAEETCDLNGDGQVVPQSLRQSRRPPSEFLGGGASSYARRSGRQSMLAADEKRYTTRMRTKPPAAHSACARLGWCPSMKGLQPQNTATVSTARTVWVPGDQARR